MNIGIIPNQLLFISSFFLCLLDRYQFRHRCWGIFYGKHSQMAGNPKYYGTFDGQGNLVSGITYTWDGRRLASLTDNTNATAVQYAYNDKGLRTKKTINGVIHNYYYDGEMLVCEKYSDITKRFIYDENGMVTSFIFKNGTTENIYFYVRDIFGIINYLIDSTGTTVVFYVYDSWGKLLSTGGTLSSTVGVQNPFLYKGYYFDFETSLYYCHSRYYNPMWHRWLNADSVDNLDTESSNGLNLFAYCGNNPIMGYDPSGCSLSNNPLVFDFGLVTPENYDDCFVDLHSFYIKGRFGWGYTHGDGYSFASLSIGIVDSTFHTPKLFSDLLPKYSLINPNIPNLYIGFGALNANISLGIGISASVEIVSGTIGIRFGDSVSLGIKGYVGVGIVLDFTNGIKFGGGLGLGFEISLEIDWWELFR